MRFSILQLMAFAVLVALFAGLVAAAREHGGMTSTTRLRFTNDGEYLTGIYGNQLHVWQRIGQGYQRLYGSRRVDDFFDAATWEVQRSNGQKSFVFQVFDPYLNEFRLEQCAVPFGGGPERVFQLPAFSDDISVSRDGESFVLRIGGSIQLFRWDSTAALVSIPVASDWQADTCLSPESGEILHVDDDSLRVWDTRTGKLRTEQSLPPAQTASRTTAGYSRDGRFICIFRGNRFQVFDAKTLNEVRWPTQQDQPWSTGLVGMDPWDVWMPGSSARLVAFSLAPRGRIDATLFDLETTESRSLSVPLTATNGSRWIASIAMSPDERWCVVSRGGRVELVDIKSGTSSMIFYPRPTVFTIIYSFGFFIWAIVWGLMSRRTAVNRGDCAQRETRLGPGAISGAFQVLGEGMMAVAIVTILFSVAICTVSSAFGPLAAVFVLAAALPAIAFFVYRARFTISYEELPSAVEPYFVEPETKPLTVPSSIVAVWIASGVGGLIAISAPTAWMMHTGWISNPFLYYSVLVGVVALSQAAACSINRLSMTAWLQLGCILSCDLVNFLIGCGVLMLLQRGEVRDFRRLLARRKKMAAERSDATT